MSRLRRSPRAIGNRRNSLSPTLTRRLESPVEHTKVRRRRMFCGECGSPESRYQPVLQELRETPCTAATCSTASSIPGTSRIRQHACTRYPQLLLPAVPSRLQRPAPAPARIPEAPWNWLGIVSLIPRHSLVGYPDRYSCYQLRSCSGLRSLFWFRKATGQDRDLLNYRNYPWHCGNCRDHYAGLIRPSPFFQRKSATPWQGRVKNNEGRGSSCSGMKTKEGESRLW